MREVHQIAYNRTPRKTPILYIVIHDTGNRSRGADAMAHYRYFHGGNRNASADFFVDDKRVLCVNDYTRYYTWHCGDGQGRYGITNENSVGIELCINVDGDVEAATEKMCQLVKELMEELHVPKERVVRHYDASRKQCPKSMAENSWAAWYDFQNRLGEESRSMREYEEIKQEIRDLTETVKQLAVKVHDLADPMIYNYIDENMPAWAREAVSWAVNQEILRGDESGLHLDDKDLRYLTILYRMHRVNSL